MIFDLIFNLFFEIILLSKVFEEYFSLNFLFESIILLLSKTTILLLFLGILFNFDSNEDNLESYEFILFSNKIFFSSISLIISSLIFFILLFKSFEFSFINSFKLFTISFISFFVSKIFLSYSLFFSSKLILFFISSKFFKFSSFISFIFLSISFLLISKFVSIFLFSFIL